MQKVAAKEKYSTSKNFDLNFEWFFIVIFKEILSIVYKIIPTIYLKYWKQHEYARNSKITKNSTNLNKLIEREKIYFDKGSTKGPLSQQAYKHFFFFFLNFICL
jgi:hypothetical protein